MSSSLVQIYNLALMRVGHSEFISDPNEASNAGNLCRMVYDQCRDQVLRDFPWRFAKKRIALALNTSTPPAEWSYEYTKPADCLRVRNLITPGNRTPLAEQKIPFELMLNEVNEEAIYTDLESAELIYTVGITDTGRFPPDFVGALAFALAAELAIPLRGKPDIAQMMRQGYSAAISQAAANSMNEGFDQIPQSSFLAVRG